MEIPPDPTFPALSIVAQRAVTLKVGRSVQYRYDKVSTGPPRNAAGREILGIFVKTEGGRRGDLEKEERKEDACTP